MIGFARAALVASLFTVAAGSGDHDHDSGTEPFEWAGIFATPEDSYTWVAQKVGGSYADDHMKVVVLPATSATETVLHSLEEEAEHSFEFNCTEVEAGETFAPTEDACFEFHFNTSDPDSRFHITTTATTAIAIFTAHNPSEFERDTHYLLDEDGHDAEGVAFLPEAEAEAASKPYGTVIGASLLINLCTLIGVILLLPCLRGPSTKNPEAFSVVANSFAAGTLLACAFYLILYESNHLVVLSSEGASAAAWGSMVLLGFLSSPIVHLLVQAVFAPAAVAPTNTKEGELEAGGAVPTSPARSRLISSVLLGDFMHNLGDGFFVGTAFRHCSSSVAWTIALATIYHELAQELSDYLVLTNPHQGALKPAKALVLNFVSGLSVLLGGVIIVALDSVSSQTIGMILAFSGGVYIYLAATECMSKVNQDAKSVALSAAAIAFFCLGAVCIGLVLFGHEHCTPSAGGDAHGHGGHAGHGHGRL